MSRVCRICLGDLPGDDDYHPRCLRNLFRTSKVPQLDIEISKLHIAALAMVAVGSDGRPTAIFPEESDSSPQ